MESAPSVSMGTAKTRNGTATQGTENEKRKIMKMRHASRHVEKLNMGKRKEISEDDTRG